MSEEKKKRGFDVNRKAVALSYSFDEAAPKVVAKGQGFIAQKILENAKNADVPVYEDKELVEELNKIDLGSNIPPELYEVVAQVLVFVSDLDRKEELRRRAR